jgi:tripartite-type tricarboxylate transporter receptor subunit TctC
MRRLATVVLALAGGLSCASALAAWPERTVKIVVPFAAGGPADGAMRIAARRLNEVWGQPVIVENKPGASGISSVAMAPGDGYTLLLGAGSSIVTAPLINRKLPYRTTDFAPVALLTTSTLILTAHPGLGVKSLKDFLAYAKSNPGALNFSSSGQGSPGHLMMEMLQQRTGTKMTHVPYKGGAPAVIDLVGGIVQAGVNATPTVINYIQAGKLLPLAVASRSRDRSLPEVPTMAEAGLPHLEFDVWYGLFAPVKTPATIIGRISTDLRQVLAEPEVQKQLRAQGNEAAGTTPAQLGQLVHDEIQVWGRLIRERNLSLDE